MLVSGSAEVERYCVGGDRRVDAPRGQAEFKLSKRPEFHPREEAEESIRLKLRSREISER